MYWCRRQTLHHLLWWFYILSAIGYCINVCLYAMLQTRATFSWPTLCGEKWIIQQRKENGKSFSALQFHLFCLKLNTRLIFYVLLTLHLGIILFIDQLDEQFFFVYIYFNSLHVSSIQGLIIRRVNCIKTTSGICLCRWPSGMQTIPDGHLHRVTYQMYTRYRIDTTESPDDEHLDARNMWRIEINIYKKELCVNLVINL